MQISDQAHVGSIPCPELISWPRETIRPLKERSGCRRGNHANGMRERSAQTRAKQLNLAELGLDVAEATMPMVCAKDLRKHARNS